MRPCLPHALFAGVSGAVQPLVALLIGSMISMFFETAPVGLGRVVWVLGGVGKVKAAKLGSLGVRPLQQPSVLHSQLNPALKALFQIELDLGSRASCTGLGRLSLSVGWRQDLRCRKLWQQP